MCRKYFKIVVVLLLLIEFCLVFLSVKSFGNKNVFELKEKAEVNKEMFSMYIENDSGNYVEYKDSEYFTIAGYKLNISKSNCVDNKGNAVTNIITNSSNKVTVSSNKTVFCYLYFDVDNSVYAKVVRDYQNNNGAALLEGTESDAYPVHYYTGNITNNNILYGGFCWKMVITTETGGVKLIYNGVPDESEEGTLTCDNTGEESQIGTSIFNPQDSLARVGYMYNKIYSNSSKGADSIALYTNIWSAGTNYYYGDKAVWNPDTNKYDLKTADGADVTSTITWSSSTYSNLVGKYTCQSKLATSCENVSYIVNGDGNNMYYYELSEGKTNEDYKIKLATSVTDNGDGTYTLENPIEVRKADWTTTYSNYKNYYYCKDLVSEICSDMYYSSKTSSISLAGYNMANVYKYGNSFTYEDGLYKLVDTIKFWYWPENYNKINNNHYTCFNSSGECTEIKYIYGTDSSIAYYTTLNDGKSVDDAINEMLYNQDVNQTNSTIKNKIDDWYKNNILNILDSNDILYSSYLENTIFCNNREITNLGGWSPNGGSTSSTLFFNAGSLKCANKTDQFTLKVEAGGEEGYGNNALDYPVGLLTRKEVNLAIESGYIKSGKNYWLLSPKLLNQWAIHVNMDTIYSASSYVNYAYGIRPAVSLSNLVEIIGGDGSVTTPYQITLPS